MNFTTNDENKKDTGPEEFYSKNIFGETVNFRSSRNNDTETTLDSTTLEDFNLFALTDAIGNRKKRDAWVLYRKAIASGVTPDDIFWKLAWQIKTMHLALKTKTPDEAMMKAFPYNKAKSFLKNFTPKELSSLYKKLVVGHEQSRRGVVEMETFIEKILLSL